MIGAVLALLALTAPGHVEPQISEAPAGARTTFGFLVEHGCDGSPTVQVSIQLPDGAFDAVPIAPAGWTGALEAVTPVVVTFTGGPLAADVEETFSVELVTPDRPGETVLFPTVQTCEAGEVGWIDPADGSEEPAPRIVLTENAEPILPTTIVEHPIATATTPTTTTTSTAAVGDGADRGDGDSKAIRPTVLVGLAVVIVIGVGLLLRIRARPRSTTAD